MNGFLIEEDSLSEEMMRFIEDCDKEELANLAGIIYGGECTVEDYYFRFIPSDSYKGQLDSVKLSADMDEVLDRGTSYHIGEDDVEILQGDSVIWEGNKEEFIKSVINIYNLKGK
jgi:hypothetical protein